MAEVTGTTETVTTETTEAPADVVVDAATTTDDGSNADTGTVLGGEDDGATASADDAKPEVVVPETYELTAPEGMTLDAEAVELAAPVFKELKLSNEDANKLMPVAAEFAKRAAAGAIAAHQIEQAQAFNAQTREWLENAKGDAEIGGAKWDASIAGAAKAMDMLGLPKGSPFRAFLNETGFGNHPEMIRVFARIGERVSEDSFAQGGSTAAPRSHANILYGKKE